MAKLFDKKPQGNEVELFQEVQRRIGVALSGQSDQFFFNIDDYLSKTPTIYQEMVIRGKNRLQDIAQKGKWLKTDTMFDYTPEDYLAIFDSLERYVGIGVDMEKEGFPTALYTRNLALLNTLNDNGQLEGDVDKVISNLEGNKTYRALQEGNYVLARLDPIAIVDGVPKFKVVVPRSNLFIGGGKRYVFIPTPFFHLFDTILRQTFATTPFRFTKNTLVGQLSFVSAVSPSVVRDVYTGENTSLVESKLRKVNTGYDPTKHRYYVYDLEASLTSLGVATFRPEMLDVLKAVHPQEIDKSRYGINFKLLRGIFKTKIKSLNKTQLESLNFIDLSSYANMGDQVEAVYVKLDRTSDKDLYLLMKNNESIFGDIDKSLKTRERLTPKFMKELKAVDLPLNQFERVTFIEDLLRRGVVSFTANTKNGGVFEGVGSNNAEVLKRMLGDEYVRDFESIRSKLYHVRHILYQGGAKSITDMEKLAVEYNILDYIDQDLYFSDIILEGDIHDAVSTIDEAIEFLKEKASYKKKPAGTLLYRSVYATVPKDFFGVMDVNKLISIEFAQVAK